MKQVKKMIELLVVKVGDEYVRAKDTGFEITKMDKASVFPVAESEQAEKLLSDVQESSPEGAGIFMLRIEEVPYGK